MIKRFDEAAYLRLIRGEVRGPAASLARFGLSLAGKAYAIGAAYRNAAYDSGRKPVYRPEIPVVSVGNLTLGGTGKTPMVEWVSRWFRARDVRVAILSRGYGQENGVNDEALVLEENLLDVPHLQGADRADLARRAHEELESQILVLDDGFQHRRLARDLDIALLDALEPFGLGKIFPRGLLREPVRSLKRAQVVVLSRADLVEPDARHRIRQEAERQAGPIAWVEARHAPVAVADAEGQTTDLSTLAGKRVVAFCGIGNPEGFRRTLQPLCGNLVDFKVFPDHHPYSAEDVASLGTWAQGQGAELALTTQKDSVKLRALTLNSIPLRYLRIGLEVMQGEATLEGALEPLLPRE
ncbi:tetraacyldisaccharide 4'-kinase [Singulisphaera sp. PoT]|uniref:tetraacyldisaccharide 4'-kinase n=1 Tax=Singulisphaera sp. PoT TaxID=3411797 RepID=UPI003BF611B4